MANITDGGTRKTLQEFLCMPVLNGIQEEALIATAALNIPLCITAFLGNVLIIVALQKVSSLHPPSKLLLGCLASTDLCVGLITQPLFVSFLLSSKHSKACYYLSTILYTIGGIFCGVSFLILTAISVDRHLALLLGLRYRQEVTLRRVRIFGIVFWISSGATVVTLFYTFLVTIGIACLILLSCAAISTFCYTKIFLTLRLHQAAIQEHVHQGQPNEGEIVLNIARYRKTVSSALWVQVTLLACYLPYGITTAVLAITGLGTPSLYFAWVATVSLLLFNSTLNPFLYCWKIKDVREAVKDIVRQFWCL